MRNRQPQDGSTFWKTYWDDHGRSGASDYEVDRGTILKIDELQRRSDEQFLNAVRPQPSDVVLDAGCGTGVNISKLSRQVGRIVGVDFSPEMIRRAERRVLDEALQNVTLHVGSISALGFADDSFDKVICTSVLQYLGEEDCGEAIREMIRVCRHGGRVIMHVKNSSSLYGLSLVAVKGLLRALGRRPRPDHYRSWRWYETSVEAGGGQVVEWDSFGKFTFVPLPQSVVRKFLELELRFLGASCFRKHGVNLKLTVEVHRQ